jgi:D-3-phosphoglycerate dehydrogenase
MGDAAPESLILDLLEWVGSGERSYEEVMDAWRTSCPRLPVWEDANDRGLVTQERVDGRCRVRITTAGLELLDQRRPDTKLPARSSSTNTGLSPLSHNAPA